MKANEGAEKEAKKIKTVLAANIRLFEADKFDTLLEIYNLWKFLRIISWVSRFINKVRRAKVKGPLTAEELTNQHRFSTIREQQRYKNDDKFKSDIEHLNLEENTEGIYECQGRLKGHYPVYLSSKSLLSEKLIFHAYLKTIHRGVNITIMNIRENYWIPGLRQLTKKVIRKCHGCKRFQSKPFTTPIPGYLPKARTDQNMLFKVIGADYTGPIYCKTKSEREVKVYILLFSCSISRAIHLELLTNQTTVEFIKALKRLVARRERPQIIYSDNA